MARQLLRGVAGMAALAVLLSSSPVLAQRGGGAGGRGGAGGGGPGGGGPGGGGPRGPGGAWAGPGGGGGRSSNPSGGSIVNRPGGFSGSGGAGSLSGPRHGNWYPSAGSNFSGRGAPGGSGRYSSGYRGDSFRHYDSRPGGYSSYRGRYDHDHHHHYYGYYGPYRGYSTGIYVSPWGLGYYGLGYPSLGLTLGLSGLYGPYLTYGGYVPGWSGSTYYYGPGVYRYGIGSTRLGYYSPGYYSSGPLAGSSTLGPVTSEPYPIYDPTAPPPAGSTLPSDPLPARSTSDEYLAAGQDAFLGGDYATARRLANHAVIESPNQAKAHELFSVALFATGEYPGAAAALHAAAALAPLADWPTLYGYYRNKDKYTEHLRALQKFVKEQPSQVDGRFLLGGHYLMLGHKAEAREELREFLKVAKDDPVGRRLFVEAGGKIDELPPLTPATIPPAGTPAATPSAEATPAGTPATGTPSDAAAPLPEDPASATSGALLSPPSTGPVSPKP